MRISSSLSNRIFLACTLIAAVPLGFAFYLINARAVVEVEAELHRRLSEEATLAAERQQTVTDTFTLFARLIADLPKLKAAVDTGDPPTVQPLADEYRAEVNADVLVLTSPRGEILGASGPDAPRLAAWTTGHPTVLAEATFDEETRLMRQPRGLLQAIRVPILLAGEPAELLGHLTLGYFLDDQLATQFKRLTGSEIAFVADGIVLASSLPSSSRQALLALAPEDGFAAATIGNEEFIVVSRPLEAGTGAAVPVVAASDVPQAPALLILRSRTERLRLLNTIRAGLGGALVVTLLLATILSYAVARTMTRPLDTVTRAMSDVAATGDLTRKVLVRSGAWDDEDARLLGAAFNRLTESVARFQRDAAQRERLSSLGRLSTVIAHEIRNPLMIVRASLAELRRDHVTAAEIREAVADIDEETMRLNRLVTDVLDFAKPLRFDLADTDVNAVCRSSTAAAFVGEGAPEARLALAPDLPRIVTDAERLRTALVNVLTNARQAVAERVRDRAAGSQGVALMEEADVVVRTAIDAGGVTISVRDRGAGIPRQDLGHIFDPYYTTRRGGTGLGLAITKNIVEGLGGTITVTAPADGGTEVQILLPAVPPGASA
jgi:two-component system sensor histidine kinase HydH